LAAGLGRSVVPRAPSREHRKAISVDCIRKRAASADVGERPLTRVEHEVLDGALGRRVELSSVPNGEALDLLR